MGDHAVLGASNSKIWMNCPGAAFLYKDLPERPAGPAALEGSIAHAAAEHALRNEWEVPQGVRIDGKLHMLQNSMLEHVQTYVDYIERLTVDAAHVLIEEKVRMGSCWPNREKPHYDKHLFGTVDYAHYHVDHNILDIVDFKYGTQVYVPPVNNTQLLYYAAGVAGVLGKLRDVVGVRMTIIQPRHRQWSLDKATWTISGQELRDWIKNEFRPAVEYILPPKGTYQKRELNPGEHCTFCPARAECPALKAKAAEAAKKAFDEYDPEGDELADRLDEIPLLKAYIRALEQKALARMQENQKVPGYKLVASPGHRKWKDPVGAAFQLEGALGAGVFYTELKSPAQIEKEFKAKDLVNELTRRPIKPALASVEDPRPEWVGDVKDAFEDDIEEV